MRYIKSIALGKFRELDLSRRSMKELNARKNDFFAAVSVVLLKFSLSAYFAFFNDSKKIDCQLLLLEIYSLCMIYSLGASRTYLVAKKESLSFLSAF